MYPSTCQQKTPFTQGPQSILNLQHDALLLAAFVTV